MLRSVFVTASVIALLAAGAVTATAGAHHSAAAPTTAIGTLTQTEAQDADTDDTDEADEADDNEAAAQAPPMVQAPEVQSEAQGESESDNDD
jgi:hypothetical protein